MIGFLHQTPDIMIVFCIAEGRQQVLGEDEKSYARIEDPEIVFEHLCWRIW